MITTKIMDLEIRKTYLIEEIENVSESYRNGMYFELGKIEYEIKKLKKELVRTYHNFLEND